MYEAAKTEDEKNRKGMALLVHKDFKDYIESFQIHSDRIISCKIRLHGESLQIIQVYAPTKDYEDTDVEKFYEDLDNAVNRKECKQHIIMGDFNAKIGIKEKNENLKWIGPHGIGIRNDRGERSSSPDNTEDHLAQITPKYHLLPKNKWKRVSRRCQKGKHQGQTTSRVTCLF